MADYTENLNLEKPSQSENYDVDVFNNNFDKIDTFAGQTPARALTADTLTVAREINGVDFKGNADIVTGLGLYSNTVNYNDTNIVYTINGDNIKVYKSLINNNEGNNPAISENWKECILGADMLLEILQTIYPIGAIYIGTTEYCPLSTLFGTWELVGAGRCLQGADTNHLPNTTIAQGLPNISGTVTFKESGFYSNGCTGCFSQTAATHKIPNGNDETAQSVLSFEAHDSNTIYGTTNNVQPAAYVVNIWRRTA